MYKTYLFAVVFICILLTACKAEDKGNLFEMPSEELNHAIAAQDTDEAMYEALNTETEDTMMPDEPGITDETDKQDQEGSQEQKNDEVSAADIDSTYAYGNMQKDLPAGNFADHQDSILFIYYNGKQIRLYEINKDTLEVTPFCKDATCNHRTSKCASLGVDGNLEACDGIIYAGKMRLADAMTGTWTMQIMQLKGDHFECILEGGYNGFWHDNHSLYVQTKDGSLLAYDEDLNHSQVLVDEYAYYWNTKFGSKIYGTNGLNGVFCTDLSDPIPSAKHLNCPGESAITDGIYIYSFDRDCNLFCSDMNGENAVQLYDVPVYPTSLNFDEEYIYFRYYEGTDGWEGDLSNKIYRASKKDLTHPEKIAEVSLYASTIYIVPGYDKLFVYAYAAPGYNDPEQEIYAINKDGSGQEKLEIPEF